MTESSRAKLQPQAAKEKLIVALDVETVTAAREIVSALAGEVGAFKIGLQLFVSGGPIFVKELVASGARVFLDLKFHDIPSTVAKACVEAARLGVWMFNVHALGGSEMMRRSVEDVADVCSRENLETPKIVAVTVLTSSNGTTLREAGIGLEVEEEVLNLVRLAAECGLDGVVASPLEIGKIRQNIGHRRFLIVTPGIRPDFATNDDQKRVMTPKEAVAAGSDYLVIGRPITQAKNRLLALKSILEELEVAS